MIKYCLTFTKQSRLVKYTEVITQQNIEDVNKDVQSSVEAIRLSLETDGVVVKGSYDNVHVDLQTNKKAGGH